MMTVRKQIEAVLAKPAIVQPVSRLLLKQLLAEHDARVKVLEDALREAESELSARCAFGSADKCAAALNQT